MYLQKSVNSLEGEMKQNELASLVLNLIPLIFLGAIIQQKAHYRCFHRK